MPELEEKRENDYEYKNSIDICGKIIYKRPIKNGNMFAISVARRLNNPRKNEETGKMEWMRLRTIDVYFEGAAGKLYDKMYEVGDFVAVNGVAQKTRNNYLARNMVKVMGLSMNPKVIGSYENKDKNYIMIRGKVDHATAISDSYIICDIYTNVHKRYKNPNNQNEVVTHFEDDYISITPIGITRPDQDATLAVKELTKGTWLDIMGYVDVRKMKLRDDNTITETRIVAQEVYIIGHSQKA